MNAHTDMLIVVGHNGLNTYQGAFIALLFRVCENLPDFRNSKTSANKRLFIMSDTLRQQCQTSLGAGLR